MCMHLRCSCCMHFRHTCCHIATPQRKTITHINYETTIKLAKYTRSMLPLPLQVYCGCFSLPSAFACSCKDIPCHMQGSPHSFLLQRHPLLSHFVDTYFCFSLKLQLWRATATPSDSLTITYSPIWNLANQAKSATTATKISCQFPAAMTSYKSPLIS